jgi:hypothetical protein
MWTEDFIFLFNALRIGAEKIFGVTISPSVLICDASKSIQNAFKHAFGSETTSIMCWAHMKKKTSKKAEQLVRPKIFEKASRMFVAKWKEEQDEFIKYFQNEWLVLNRN